MSSKPLYGKSFYGNINQKKEYAYNAYVRPTLPWKLQCERKGFTRSWIAKVLTEEPISKSYQNAATRVNHAIIIICSISFGLIIIALPTFACFVATFGKACIVICGLMTLALLCWDLFSICGLLITSGRVHVLKDNRLAMLEQVNTIGSACGDKYFHLDLQFPELNTEVH